MSIIPSCVNAVKKVTINKYNILYRVRLLFTPFRTNKIRNKIKNFRNNASFL